MRKPRVLMSTGSLRIVRTSYGAYLLEKRDGSDCMDVARWRAAPADEISMSQLVREVGNALVRREKARRSRGRAVAKKACGDDSQVRGDGAS